MKISLGILFYQNKAQLKYYMKKTTFRRNCYPLVAEKGNCGDKIRRRKFEAKKALRTNKPDSVHLTEVRAPSFIWTRRRRRVLAAYPPARASSPSTPAQAPGHHRCT